MKKYLAMAAVVVGLGLFTSGALQMSVWGHRFSEWTWSPDVGRAAIGAILVAAGALALRRRS
jgi:hypothetical protein